MPRPTLPDDERGVTPTVATVLVIAIAVTLSAVMGTYVLQMGQEIGEKPPQASFTCDGSGMTMQSGDRIHVDRLDGVVASDINGDGDDYLEAGETVVGVTQLRWTSATGETSTIVARC
jgi:flagellin-like protein